MKHFILIAFLALLSQPASAQFAQQWAKTFDDPKHGDNQPTGIALTNSGCVVVIGTTYDTAQKIYHMQTIKYDPSGNVLWQTEFPSSLNCNPTAITTDTSGNIFISVDIYAVKTSVLHVLKYSCAGTLVWDSVFSTASPIFSSFKIALDSNGNIYIGASAFCFVCYQNVGEIVEAIIIKFDGNGHFITEMRTGKVYSNKQGNYSNYLNGMRISSSGEIYSIFNFSQESNINNKVKTDDFGLEKHDASGRREFLKRIPRPDKDDYPASLFVGKNEDVFITGWTEDTTVNAKKSYLTVKLDSSGNILYGKERGNAAWNSEGVSIVADSLGNAYVAGKTFEHGATSDIELIKYDPKGNEVWVKTYNSTFNNWDYPNSIHIDAQANIYINASSSNGKNFDFLVLKFDSSGSLIGEYRTNGASNKDDYPASMAVNASGEIFVTGSSQGANGYDFLTVKYGFPTSVTGDNQCLGTSVSESKSADNTFSIYPDPANEFITMNWQFAENKKVEVKIIDVKGAEVLHAKANGPEFKLDIQSLPSGVYIVMMSEGGVSKSQNISIQR